MAWSNREKIRRTVEQNLATQIAAEKQDSKSPAFQFYPKDFLSDENVRVMSLQERGAYITLLSLCWIEGSLPADVDRLARLCGVPVAVFRKLWPALIACFRDGEPGRLIHPRLEREREKQATYRRRQSDAAAMRWQSHRNAAAMPRHSQATADAMPDECHRNALHLQSSSSSADCSQDEEKIKNVSLEPHAASKPEDTSPIVLTYPTIGTWGQQWHLRERQVGEWRDAYPAIDVLGECRRAWAWLNANPQKRKTAKGMPRFLNAWLGRKADRDTSGPRLGEPQSKTANNLVNITRALGGH